MTIGKLTRVEPAMQADFLKLVKCLRSDPKEHQASLASARAIVNDKNAIMIVVKDGKRLVGMGTLYMLPKLGQRVGYIEDVVVDTAYRGQGLGEKVIRALIAAAKKNKLHVVSLTSRPEREAANKLYQKVGFEKKSSNVYRVKI